jgi:hypothetical protein
MGLGSHSLFLESAVKADSASKGPKVDIDPKEAFSYGVNFTMQAQTQSNWCWAATATSTSIFYLSTSTWTQCTVANSALGRSDCCVTPGPCNVTWYLESALAVTGNYNSMTSAPSTGAVGSELQAGRPVGARVSWAGGGAHAIVISGYSYVMQAYRFVIEDPVYGRSQIFVWEIQDGYYQGSGTWTHLYFTKAAP